MADIKELNVDSTNKNIAEPYENIEVDLKSLSIPDNGEQDKKPTNEKTDEKTDDYSYEDECRELIYRNKNEDEYTIHAVMLNYQDSEWIVIEFSIKGYSQYINETSY